MDREEKNELIRRKEVIEEVLKRWLKRGVQRIKEIKTSERLCKEVWRLALKRYIRKMGGRNKWRRKREKGRMRNSN